MKTIKPFFDSINQQAFDRGIHEEIAKSIFPQLCGEKDGGYPFKQSEEELKKLAVFGNLDTQLRMGMIELRLKELPETYRAAFAYIMYRDLNAHLELYLKFVQATASCSTAPQPAT